jgi:mRNA interferase HigB
VAENAWRSFAELRLTLPSADQLRLDRVLVVTVFNVGGNKYRLVSEVNYGLQLVRALLVMPRSEYDRGRWKGKLTR